MHNTITLSILMSMIALDGVASTRLKDLVSIEGIRDNQLMGYGLVVGLNGTGDKRQTVFSTQTLTNLLARMGISVNPTAIQVRNVASVLVTANLPPFAQTGSRLDVAVSTIGDASNLQGGMLVLTPLKGADGQIYAVSQGSVITGGFVAGRGGNTQTVNHPTTGRIPNGAIIEKNAPSVTPGTKVRLQLRQADFTTAARISAAINRKFAAGNTMLVAHAENAGLIEVEAPAEYKARAVEFLSELENVRVEADRPARIVINERSGTIVMGKEVQIAPVSILHGGLTVEIQTGLTVSQPEPLSQGKTAVTPDVKVSAKQEKAKNIVLKKGASVEELVQAMLAIGSTPRDVIAILQNLKASGALDADLEVI